MNLLLDQNRIEPMVTTQKQSKTPEMVTFEQLSDKAIKITDFIGQITYLGCQTQIMITSSGIGHSNDTTAQNYAKGYINLSELMSNFDLDKHIEQVENRSIIVIPGNGIESGIYFHPNIVTQILMRYNSKTISLMNQIINKQVLSENTQNLDSYDQFMRQINNWLPTESIRLIDERVLKLDTIKDQTANTEIQAFLQDQKCKLAQNKQEQLRRHDIHIETQQRQLQQRLRQSNIDFGVSLVRLQELLDIANQHEQDVQAPKKFKTFRKGSGMYLSYNKEEFDEVQCQLPIIQVRQTFRCYCYKGLNNENEAPPPKIFIIFNKQCLPFTFRDIAYHLDLQNIKANCQHRSFSGFQQCDKNGILDLYGFGS